MQQKPAGALSILVAMFQHHMKVSHSGHSKSHEAYGAQPWTAVLWGQEVEPEGQLHDNHSAFDVSSPRLGKLAYVKPTVQQWVYESSGHGTRRLWCVDE